MTTTMVQTAGRRKRSLVLLLAVLVCTLAAPALARADTYVPKQLLAQATASPSAVFSVVVLGEPGVSSRDLLDSKLGKALGKAGKTRSGGTDAGEAQHVYSVVNAISASVTGAQLLALSQLDGVRSIMPDTSVRHDSLASGTMWQQALGIAPLWGLASAYEPTIAIVDSGVDKHVLDLRGRVTGAFNIAAVPKGPQDPNGHGTLVAGIAAGASTTFPGTAPNANILSLRVVDAQGVSRVSDVIAAADWIFQNATKYDIRIVNFSLSEAAPAPAFYDPLSAAVTRLWLRGIVVVASAGNNGPQTMAYAPGDNPFAITVGAADINDTVTRADDFNAPWSSYGYTPEGFAKPELGAPGRWMIGPTSGDTVLASEFPSRMVGDDHMWMSGTSFAAPVVSGLAALVLSQHPSWTPDQVKGALMVSARATPAADASSLGIGVVDGSAVSVSNPPNPNEGLDAFVRGDTFDADAWNALIASGASWTNASWTNASWTNASWTNVSWTNASWTNASWTNASWTNVSWTNASWTNASWTNASWTNASWTNASWTN